MKMPVFVVTGFLDAGKTTFLTQILEEEGFSEEDKTLIIMCEEGEAEYDEKTLSELNIDVVSVDSQEDFTPEFLADCARIYKPECIFIEYNGMWKTQDLFDMKLPKGWFFNQVVTIVDGSTFDVYLNNMRSLMMDIFAQSELVIFNRCDEDMPLNSYRRSIKAVNRRAQVIFEDEDGEIIDYNYPPDKYLFIRNLEKALDNYPPDFYPDECKKDVVFLYNSYCKENYTSEEIIFFDDYTITEVLKKSKICVKWDNNFSEMERAKKAFLDLNIVKKLSS